jgi:uncharacterized membrane protein
MSMLPIYLHLSATAFMAGLIWFVQIVHYPLFAHVGATAFVEYETLHTRLTSFVVGPAMAIEGVSALLIAGWYRDDVGLGLVLAGLALLAVIHASTVTLQVPSHRRLSEAHDRDEVAHLVRTNWIRTAGWSARTGVAVAMMVVAA